jgi:hypothetical protein
MARRNCAKAVKAHGTPEQVSVTFFDIGEVRLIGDSGAGDEDNPPLKRPHRSKPENCERCGAVRGPGTVTRRFGDQSACEVFLCVACGFIEWVAVS